MPSIPVFYVHVPEMWRDLRHNIGFLTYCKNIMNFIEKSVTLPDGRVITIETGRIARQADGAIVLRTGDTMLLATTVSKRDLNLETDFLPLTVDYIESYAATGKFPGGFMKREGKLSDHEVLISRLIDRALRPLFPDDYVAETQVIVQLFSSDKVDQPDALACLAASAALMVSDVPFPDPVSEVRIARKNGQWVINPTFAEMAECDVDLMIAATDDAIMMVEGEMKEVGEEVMLEAFKVAHDAIRKLNAVQHELRAAVGKTVRNYDRLEMVQEMYDGIKEIVEAELSDIAHSASGKEERSDRTKAIKDIAKKAMKEKFTDENGDLTVQYFDVRFNGYFKSIQKEVVRNMVVRENLRLDGRKTDEIRPIWSETSYLPRVHGSSVFTRGETQAICTVTLGTKLDEQKQDGPTIEGTRRFMLHYNFPGYSTGEAKAMRGPGRREVGHGNLAERSLKGMMPAEYPYTVRVVSNITESNGSSSMASVCGGTLALMDAGVKITRPVSGIAMGLITTSEGFAVLSDILGDEDFLGDMDFKVAGTVNGLTACQMDIKIRGLSYEVIEKALAQSKAGRAHILGEMLKALPEVRTELSQYAPRFFEMAVPVEFFGAVIGPGGKVIQEIQRSSGTTIVLEELNGKEGKATITGPNAEAIDKAVRSIKSFVAMPEVGDVYTAKVKSIMPYGAFVEFMPGKEGLLHISEVSHERLDSLDGVFNVGEQIEVKLVGIDAKSGKFRISRKALLPEPQGRR